MLLSELKVLLIFWIAKLITSANVVELIFNELNFTSPESLITKGLPEDLRFMPTLGNGHLGFTVLGDHVYLNGVYNGKMGISHRARIPNYSNITFVPDDNFQSPFETTYLMHLKAGMFETRMENEHFRIMHLVFAHRFYNRAIINILLVYRLRAKGVFRINIRHQPGQWTEDIDFSEPATIMFSSDSENDQKNRTDTQDGEGETIHLIQGYTREVEDDSYQKSRKHVCCLWNHVPEEITLHEDQRSASYRFVMTADELCSMAEQEMTDGLGRGGNNLDDYQGHNFWDTEIWMLPSVTQMDPKWTRQLLRYRYQMVDAAKNNARSAGFKGSRFPWESAFTGTEVTNPCCLIVAKQQFHITADIAFALKHYFSVTQDDDWLHSEGCILAKNIAEFWASRVEIDNSSGLYDIKYVMGPDEDHSNVTNNVFTNAVASCALKFGGFACSRCNCRQKANQIDTWTDIAEKLKILYDEELDYHPQYEGYQPSEIIKQADVVLLGYPLLHPMNHSTRANDLKVYEKVTRDSGPAMTWAMHAINHLDAGNYQKAEELFERSYQSYVRSPFQVWSEVTKGQGAANFITGAGGFLQSLINGYAGVRFYLDRMEINKPKIPANVNKFTLSGIKYLGSIFNIIVTSTESLLHCPYSNVDGELELIDNEKQLSIFTNFTYKIITSKVIVKRKS